MGRSPRLNRTSVGLNLESPEPDRLWGIAPQSNQRGIELMLRREAMAAWKGASIEPAWD